MKVNKRQIQMIAGVLTVILVYNILAFLLPFHHNGVFWIGYSFGMVALITQIAIFALAFYDARTAASRFYGIPVARVGLIYLVCQLIVSFFAMMLGGIESFPTWPIILVSILLFAAAVLGTIATDATRDEIVRQDAALKQNVQSMRTLQSIGVQLAAQSKGTDCAEEMRKLSEQLRYSDPVSNPATVEAENEIKAILSEIQQAILDRDFSAANTLCRNASSALSERNRICKLNKH